MPEQDSRQGENRLLKQILNSDLPVKRLDFQQVKKVVGYLEKQGVRVGRIHTSLIDCEGYGWRKFQETLRVESQQALYLDCLARASELGKVEWVPVTG